MNFFSKVATKDSFEETIRRAPRVLHISCHGIRLKDRSSALLFENQYGAGDLVTEEQLTNLLKSSQKKIELIFLAACDSERIGKIFQKCGIPHVICVKQERFVLDEAAIKFTSTLYQAVFSGRNICDAFSEARSAVAFTLKEVEANLFTMLRPEDYEDPLDPYAGYKKKRHTCRALAEPPYGQWNCMSEHNLVKRIPAQAVNFKFRDREVSRLLEMILGEDSRMVQLLGLRGIGKSSLAKSVLHYAAARKMFTGGVLFIKLKGINSCFVVMKMVMREIMRALELTRQEKMELKSENCSQDRMMEYFKTFFTFEYEQKLRKKKHNSLATQDKRFLLCFDNAEEAIEHDGTEFRNLLAELYDECDQLYVLVTTNQPMGELPN